MQQLRAHYVLIGILTGVFMLLWLGFSLCPQTDITLSAVFYDPAHPDRFALMYDPLMRFIQKGVHWLAYGAIGLPILLLLAKKLSPRRAAFLLLALALGPGLVVHGIFKETFERPRPVHSDVFGGEHAYLPPMVIGQDGGKSFTSGHAAMGFYFAAFALLATTRRWQIALYLLGIGCGLLLGGCRIVQGRHFLSDVLFSGVLTLLCTHIAYVLVYRQRAR